MFIFIGARGRRRRHQWRIRVRTPRLELVSTGVALVLAGAVVACSQTTPSAAPPSLTSQPQTTTTTTSTAPPTAVPGPNGTTIPVFQQPYLYGTPQASVPPTTDGKAPIVKRIDTDLPYVFITIDDGAVRNSVDLELMRADIVLMHFRNTFVEDFTAFLTRAKKDGLTPVPLEDFLSTEPMRH
jgi:hypothetical protein